jgi:hypothetical protein
LDPEAAKTPVTKMVDPPTEGRRDARGVYTRMEGPREASVVNRVLELAEAVHTDDRQIMLKTSPEDELDPGSQGIAEQTNRHQWSSC